MIAARDGDVATLKMLIQDKKIDINTRGPDDITWVS